MNIFVGGSTSELIDKKYMKEADKLGAMLANTKNIVYCCASINRYCW